MDIIQIRPVLKNKKKQNKKKKKTLNLSYRVRKFWEKEMG